MDQSRYCPECGAELPADVMEGLCPNCMAQVVFGEGQAGSENRGDSPGATERIPESDFEIERTGMMIGRYKLLEQIGEGGFGMVYMAEQVEPVHRKVALKIIKAGMDSKAVIARFEAERQAAALMDHPSIAKVLDGGVTQAGRPYFVMELVRGIPITEFCDQRNLDTTERLKLFILVCKAVQHAHQKGIIHRDLKPSNILVTLHDGEPVPKIIDFGVAKALGAKLTDKTLFTGFLHLVGTPAYMSPEQAELSGLDIDTRSDIYSLGVLLYELLTGVTPFDAETLRNAAIDEVRRMIRETEPPRPSNRLQTLGKRLTEVAKRRHVEAPKLIHLVRGDLDWIVMQCLEKDRQRRYETASGLAMDVQRHLDNEPIAARPPSAGYRVRKMVSRNKLTVAATLTVMFSLTLGGVATAWLAIDATRAQKGAEAAADREGKLRLEAEGRESTTKAQILFLAGDLEAADELIRELPPEYVERDVETVAPILRALAHWHAGAKRWRQSADYYHSLVLGPAKESVTIVPPIWPGATVTLSPLPGDLTYFEYAPLLIELGDLENYRRLRENAISRFTVYEGRNPSEPMLHACLLAPVDGPYRVAICKWALAVYDYEGPRHYDCTALALFEYRRGEYERALEWCRKCRELNPGGAYVPRVHVLSAMAYAGLGQQEAAQAELAQCREPIESKFSGELGVGGYGVDLWADWLIDRVLLKEADALLASRTPRKQNLEGTGGVVSASRQRQEWDAAMTQARRELAVAAAQASASTQ